MELRGVRPHAHPLDIPLQLIGFTKRKNPIETARTVKVRYFYKPQRNVGNWRPVLIVEARYWKGDNPRPVKYNLQRVSPYGGRYERTANVLITTDPSALLDRANKEIANDNS